MFDQYIIAGVLCMYVLCVISKAMNSCYIENKVVFMFAKTQDHIVNLNVMSLNILLVLVR